MDTDEVTALFRTVEQALLGCNNCVATDLVDREPVKGESWRVDNSKALSAITALLDHYEVNKSLVYGR